MQLPFGSLEHSLTFSLGAMAWNSLKMFSVSSIKSLETPWLITYFTINFLDYVNFLEYLTQQNQGLYTYSRGKTSIIHMHGRWKYMVEEKMDLDPLLYLHLHLEGRKRETHTQDLGWFFEKNDQNLSKSYVFFFFFIFSAQRRKIIVWLETIVCV